MKITFYFCHLFSVHLQFRKSCHIPQSQDKRLSEIFCHFFFLTFTFSAAADLKTSTTSFLIIFTSLSLSATLRLSSAFLFSKVSHSASISDSRQRFFTRYFVAAFL